MDRLHEDLMTLPGLAQLSASQLRDLPWRVKELVLITLFQEQVSSSTVTHELQNKSRDRKLERKAEKLLDDVDQTTVRKKEDKYRADFMQVVASELARLGAPALITWQKLVFDKECCAQAFRLLLTRIKSSRRSMAHGSSTSSSSALAARFAAGQSSKCQRDSKYCAQDRDDEDNQDDTASSDKLECCTRFPPLSPTQSSRSRSRTTGGMKNNSTNQCISNTVAERDWNFDTSIETSPERDESEHSSSREPVDRRNQATRHGFGPEIIIERRVLSKQPSYFVSKLKNNKGCTWQEEKAVLTSENTKLRDEIKHLEALIAVLQGDSSSNSLYTDQQTSRQLAQKRMRLLQAQNMQLQRQVSLLFQAKQAYENAEVNLMSALDSWRSVIEAGREQAKAAGADQNATETPADREKKECRQPIKWMLAVPDKLMHELKRVKSQIQSASNASKACFETKLRVSTLSASFLRNEGYSLKLSELFDEESTCLSHLRIERVKQLEDALGSISAQLDELSAQVLHCVSPKITFTEPLRSCACELGKSVRNLLLEVEAFGVVVPSSASFAIRDAAAFTDKEAASADEILKGLISVIGVGRRSGNIKECKKQIMLMLNHLQARQRATDNDLVACRRETDYWRTAWYTQGDILRKLVKCVRMLGQKKVEWCRQYLLAPMVKLHDVFASFMQAYDENTTRQNPYLPSLVETLSMVFPTLQTSLQQWRDYSSGVQEEMNALFEDYEANRLILASSLGTSAAKV